MKARKKRKRRVWARTKALPHCLVVNGRTLACFARREMAEADRKALIRQHARRGFRAVVTVETRKSAKKTRKG